MRVCHIIISLDLVGGAERILTQLALANCKSTNQSVVLVLDCAGALGTQLKSSGIAVHELCLGSFWRAPFVLKKWICSYRPDVVQTWMYHSDILGGVAARMAGSCAVVWGIRSNVILQGPLSISYWIFRFCAILSHIIPHRIICNAKSAKASHVKIGYAANKINVIPNGYDFSAFDRHINSRTKARRELGYNNTEIIIGAVGRFNPMKDFHGFVTAASKVAAKRDNVKFLMVGRNIVWSNLTLRGWIEDAGLLKNFQIVGEQSDVPYFLSSMDIYCLTSVSEAFPNVVAEAMACGTPCVVTDVGDARLIVGDTGWVVSPSDPSAVAEALQEAIEEMGDTAKWSARKASCRSRILENYSLDRMVDSFYKVWTEVSNGYSI
jgi:glycosyltransferase involved in cell wall biosynthesis